MASEQIRSALLPGHWMTDAGADRFAAYNPARIQAAEPVRLPDRTGFSLIQKSFPRLHILRQKTVPNGYILFKKIMHEFCSAVLWKMALDESYYLWYDNIQRE